MNSFLPSHFLYEDVINAGKNEFRNYIYGMTGNNDLEGIKTEKTPKELLDEVGYDLYECTTEEEIQSFKKYYEPEEQLCTFHGGRLLNHRVFFAIKKNVDYIRNLKIGILN